MTNDVIDDLKQFIATTISQLTSDLREEFHGMKQEFAGLKQEFAGLKQEFIKLDEKVSSVDHKVDDLIVFVTDAIDTSNETAGKQLQDHEQRIIKLEHAAAA